MKTNTTNPWPIIRWMAAAVLYILTVVIAIDQVRIRDAKLQEIRLGLAQLAVGNDQMQAQTKELMKSIETQIEIDQETAIKKSQGLLNQIETYRE